MKEFKIIYNNEKEYKMNSFLGSILIDELYDAEIKDNEENPILHLTLYQDVFDILYYDYEFKYEEENDDKETKLKKIRHILDGLKYFMSNRLGEFILYVKNNMYDEEKQKIGEFFTRHRNKLDRDCFENLCRNTSILIDFIVKIDKYNTWYWVCKNPSIPIEFFKENLDKIEEHVAWYFICQNTSIPIEFFEEHKDKIDDYMFWYTLCANPSVPLEFYENNIDMIIHDSCWIQLCQNPSISVEFINKHIDKLYKECWTQLCQNPSIPVEFFKEHIDKIIWPALCLNKSIPFEFFKENLDKLDADCWENLCENPSMPLNFFKEHMNKIEEYKTWYWLCKNPSIPFEFFKENIDKTNLYWLCSNTSIPLEFFKENLDRLDNDCWLQLCRNTSIPVEFFEENLDKLDAYCWSSLCQNCSIPLEFFKEHLNQLNGNCWQYLCENTFNLKKKIDNVLKEIDPFLNDKYIQTSFIIMCCLQILDKEMDDDNIELLQKLCINEYPLLSNTLVYSKGKKYFYPQIKHFLCTLKEGNEYKDELELLCSGKEEKQEKKQREIKEDTFIINTYDVKNPIRNADNSDMIQIFGDDRTITLIKENDVFHDIESLDYYDMNDLTRFQGSKAYILKGEGNKEKQEIEEKQRITKDIDNQKNMALHTIHERLQEEIPELTFKMFYEAYNNMYSHKNPLTFTEKEFNSLFHKVKKYLDIKKLEREKRLRELQLEVKEEVKEKPIHRRLYNALLRRDRSLTVNEFNRIYTLIRNLFDGMTFNERVNLMYNHINEIRNN